MISIISFRIALPIILVGLFAIVIFVALEPDKLDVGFYMVFLSLVVYIFLFGFAIGQNFVLPIKKLLKRAIELSKGDLTTRVYLETKDEFGQLAKIFNEIAEDLEESYSTAEKTKKSVDIKVRVRTQDMEETINALEQKVKNRTIELEKIINELQELTEEANNKGKEILELKKESISLKSKIGKYRPKKEDKGAGFEPKSI